MDIIKQDPSQQSPLGDLLVSHSDSEAPAKKAVNIGTATKLPFVVAQQSMVRRHAHGLPQRGSFVSHPFTKAIPGLA